MIAKSRAPRGDFLGKTNLDEYAPASIARSALGGQTVQLYDTKRVPGVERRFAQQWRRNEPICRWVPILPAPCVFRPLRMRGRHAVVTQGLVEPRGVTFLLPRWGPTAPRYRARDRGGALPATTRGGIS